jgi:hypothetical protein
MSRCFELERVPEFGEIWLSEPARGRGAVALGQKARASGYSTGEQLDPDRNDSTQKLKEIQRDSFSTAYSTISWKLESPCCRAETTAATHAMLGGIGPENMSGSTKG